MLGGWIRGDCYRGSGASELAVRDYKLALEVEPGNWMVKTRLSLAHYLKVQRAIDFSTDVRLCLLAIGRV